MEKTTGKDKGLFGSDTSEKKLPSPLIIPN
jgi:hypothetical protein